jgi:putative transposase
VVVEHLNVAGMMRNRRLARALADTGMSEIRRQLSYKTTWYGSKLVVADPFYPSSKTCSACGWVRAKLSLTERTFNCEVCGLVLDRDLNAARNLAKLVHHVAWSGRETRNACGGDVRPGLTGQTPRKQEPCAAAADKAGTAGPQGSAT